MPLHKKRAARGRLLIVRTGGVFAASERPHFVADAVRRLVGDQDVPTPSGGFISPTYAPDLANAVLDLLIDGETGFWHLTHGAALQPADFLARLAAALGMDGARVRPMGGGRAQGWIPPAHAALASDRGGLMPSLDDALSRYAAAMAPQLDAGPNQLLVPTAATAPEGTKAI